LFRAAFAASARSSAKRGSRGRMNTSVSDLIQQLADKEQEKVQKEKKIAERVKEIRSQVEAAAEENMRLQRALVQDQKDARAHFDKALRDQAFNCKARLHQEIRARAAVESKAQKAKLMVQQAQEQCVKLTLKIQDLQAHLEERKTAAGDALRDLDEQLKERVERVSRQGDRRTRDMQQHTLQNSLQLGCQLDDIMGHCKDQLRSIHIRAEGHTRLKELCQLAAKRDTPEMSRENYRKVKGDLLGLWQLQKQGVTRSPSPRSLATSPVSPATATPRPISTA